MDKNFKIWGMSYGLIGDLIMGLPMLEYFEKKYPGSYKYWVIEKKCALSAALYFNHPLIDRIKITDEWGGFGDTDRKLMGACQVKTTSENWKHSRPDWYNFINCVEETAIIAGVHDLTEILSKDEMTPQLHQWFDTGVPDVKCNTYSKKYIPRLDASDKNISIWPFASGTGGKISRSPSVGWWTTMINMINDNGYTVHHFGHPNEPALSTSVLYTHHKELSYFEQVKASLASNISIGTDSGAMWVMGAYSHPSIHLMTNWMNGHAKNFTALEPINDNGKTFFTENGCDHINHIEIMEHIKENS